MTEGRYVQRLFRMTPPLGARGPAYGGERERESRSTDGKRKHARNALSDEEENALHLINKYFLHAFLLLLFFQEDNALHFQRRILAGIIVHLAGLFCFYRRSLAFASALGLFCLWASMLSSISQVSCAAALGLFAATLGLCCFYSRSLLLL